MTTNIHYHHHRRAINIPCSTEGVCHEMQILLTSKASFFFKRVNSSMVSSTTTLLPCLSTHSAWIFCNLFINPFILQNISEVSAETTKCRREGEEDKRKREVNTMHTINKEETRCTPSVCENILMASCPLLGCIRCVLNFSSPQNKYLFSFCLVSLPLLILPSLGCLCIVPYVLKFSVVDHHVAGKYEFYTTLFHIFAHCISIINFLWFLEFDGMTLLCNIHPNKLERNM